MRIAYSCVVDAKPKFEGQALLWTHSLLRNGGCRPCDLHLHCLPGISERFRRSMAALGVRLWPAQPFAGGQVYCNKIQQCASRFYEGCDKVILADTDLFFLAAPQLPAGRPFAGMIVDLENPPLEMLHALYQEAGIRPSATVPVGCALSPGERTLASNLNGGFYAIDRTLLDELGRHWEKHAHWMLGRVQRLGVYHVHVDQIAMALALDELAIEAALLPAQYNFPLHLPNERLSARAAPRVEVLHYHAHVLPGGQIKATGIPQVDSAIARANRDIQAILGDHPGAS